MKKLVTLGIICLCATTLVACGTESVKEKTESSSASTSSMVSESKEATSSEKTEVKSGDSTKGMLEGDTYTINDTVYEITGTEVVDGAGGTRVLAIKFDFTNNSEEAKDMLDSIMYVHGVQETDNTIEDLLPGTLPYSSEASELDDRASMIHTKIKPGATVQGVILYQLVNDAPVTVTFSDRGFNDIGEKVYEVQ